MITSLVRSYLWASVHEKRLSWAGMDQVARSGRPGRVTAYFAWVDGVACQVTFFALDGASLPYEATLAAMVTSLQASPP